MATATRKCRHCKERKRTEDMVITPNNAAFCDQSHLAKYAAEHGSVALAKRRREEKRENKKAVRELNRQSLKWQIKETQREFNKLVRMLDEGQPCISCNRTDDQITEDWMGGRWDCGHFKTRGGHTELKFCFLNAYRQCKTCNGGSGKYTKKNTTVAKDYEENLRKRMGDCVVEWLNGPHEIEKFTCEQLEQMRAMYTAEQRYIKEHGRPSRNWRQFPPLEAAV